VRACVRTCVQNNVGIMPKFDFNTTVAETKWSVEPIIPLGHLGIVLAQSGVGKSLIVESLAVHIVHEVPFCGFNTNFGDVLIIDQDTPTNVLTNRLIKFGKAMGCAPKHRLFVESMKDYSLADSALRTVIKDHGSTVLVIIDSLHSVCGRLNPNYTSDMNILAKLKSDCLTGHRTILINHHISEKSPYTIAQLMTDNSHSMSMGNSAIIQQADTFYIVGAMATNGLTSKLYIRPVAKRVSIRPTPLILQIVQPTPDSERLEYQGDYVLNFSEVELDCLTLFKEYPFDRTVKQAYDDMGQRHGIIAVREALASLNTKGLLLLSRHKSNLFKYKALQ